jgi:hypothetical protein
VKDRRGEPAEARRLYLRAVKAYPKEAAVHNNLALFYAGEGMFNESVSAFARAVQLQPKNPKYRNNFARLLVRMGRTREALAHLRAAHREAVACYNLGYLLEEQGQNDSAAERFALALRFDPSLTPARHGLERLQRLSMQSQPPDHPARSATRASRRLTPGTGQSPRPDPYGVGRPASSQQLDLSPPGARQAQSDVKPLKAPQPDTTAPLPPAGSRPVRLPPTLAPQSAIPEPLSQKPVPDAPLPPRTANAAVLLHLPPVK